MKALEGAIAALQTAFQAKEREFADVVKIGRTQLQDAVPITLGAEFSAWADALGRDRWRVFKCAERLRVVNLGGTAVGTGITAPRDHIFQVVDRLRELTGLGLSRAENLMDATQNVDPFVEVSGILKAHAVDLFKISSDLRLLVSGPRTGLGEIHLPAVQAGSSVMPGKVNPVIPEAVGQAALRVIGDDAALTAAAMSGQLELNAFLPLIADALLGWGGKLVVADGRSTGCSAPVASRESRSTARPAPAMSRTPGATVTALAPAHRARGRRRGGGGGAAHRDANRRRGG